MMLLGLKSNQEAVTGLVVRAVAATLAALLVRFLYKGYQSRAKVRKLAAQGIPTLPHSWLTGHITILLEFRNSHPSDVSFYRFPAWLKATQGRHFPDGKVPGVVYVDLWPLTYSYAFVLDGEAGTQFTMSPSLDKHAVVGDYLRLMTHGHDLFAGNGQLWKKWRTRLNPGFSSRHMATMIPDILDEVIIFADILKAKAGVDGTWGDVLEMEPKAINLTFNVITRTVIDIAMNDQKAETGHPIKTSMIEQIELINKVFVNPLPSLPFTPKARQLKAIEGYNVAVRDILQPLIATKIGERAEGSDGSSSSSKKTEKNKRQTSLCMALQTMDKDLEKEGPGGADQAAYIDQLIGNLKIMMFAGHDTTAITICMMFKCLQDNPRCLEELRAEHDAVLGPHTDVDKVADTIKASPHLIHSLPYTLAVIKETLRLYPIASTVRQGTRECFLRPRGETTQYPTGGWAVWSGITVIHKDPEYWPRPDEFLPERWTVEAGHPLHPVLKHAWQAFSIGPRNCIGMELALTELKLVSVFTARTLEIREAWDEWDKERGTTAAPAETINGERLYMVGAGTMHPKDGMPVCVRRRVS